MYSHRKGRRFLISESVRGEGALLLDKNGNRFTNELQPRDVVAAAIYAQMEKDGADHVLLDLRTISPDIVRAHIRAQMEMDGTDHVWEDMRPIGEAAICEHFPNILERCEEEGYDPIHEPIPVVPAQHYFMGGITADLSSRTALPRLYACGETCCNGVHGRNRLASNSLLESLVFSKRAAQDLVEHYSEFKGNDEVVANTDLKKYEDRETMEKENIRLVAAAIEKANGGTPMNSEYRHV